MKTTLTALALLGGLLLTACGGAKPAPEANKNTASKPAATPAAAEKPKAEADKPKAEMSEEGETLTNADAGVKFTVPKGWKSEKGESLTVTSPDDGVAVSFVVSSADDLEKAVDAAANEMDKLIKNAKIEQQGKESTVNGLKAVSMNGTGELEGKPVAWDLSIVVAKKPLLVISIGAPESIQKHGKDYETMVNSIKPL